jgi:hypothetical protein
VVADIPITLCHLQTPVGTTGQCVPAAATSPFQINLFRQGPDFTKATILCSYKERWQRATTYQGSGSVSAGS